MNLSAKMKHKLFDVKSNEKKIDTIFWLKSSIERLI
jgi:hypothetical protein